MKLYTSRLSLYPMESKDFEAVHIMNSYPEAARYNTIGIPDNLSVTEKRLQKVLENERNKTWILRDIETNVFIGEMGMNLSPERYHKGEIYYSLHPDFWGNGYAIEGVKAMINFGFSELRLHRIEAGVAVENAKSIALLEKIGMSREGLCRKILPLQSGWSDNYMYAILEEDSREY